jgi:hypothetical protein
VPHGRGSEPVGTVVAAGAHDYDRPVAVGVLLPAAAVLVFLAVPFLLALFLPPRWVVAVGAVMAAGEWFLAYRRSVDRDDAREGLSLVLFTGTFAVALLLLWSVGVAMAVLVRRRRAGSA